LTDNKDQRETDASRHQPIREPRRLVISSERFGNVLPDHRRAKPARYHVGVTSSNSRQKLMAPIFVFATTFTVGILSAALNLVNDPVYLSGFASSLLTSIWRASFGL
jgi:hypothetical protein